MTPSASVQAARAAAQLREAARDVARVAELRSRGAELVPRSAQQDGSAIAPPPPASLMGLVAARLAAAGLDVRQDDGDGGSQIAVACDGGRFLGWAGDFGYAEWEWHPDGAADPKQLADLATVLLAGAGSNLARRGDGYGRPGITFKGIVGTELAARGLDVRLGVYEDTRNYDVTAEVVATNPASTQAGTVYVTDSGTLTWACQYWDQNTAATPPPAAGQLDADPADAAKTISRTIIRAIAKAHPDSGAAGQTEAVHGHAEPE